MSNPPGPRGELGEHTGTLLTQEKSTRFPGWVPTHRASLVSLYSTADLVKSGNYPDSMDHVCNPQPNGEI